MQRVFARAANVGVSAVEHEGDVPIREALAKLRAISVTECMVQDGTREPVVLHEDEGMLERIRGCYGGAGSFESLADVHSDKRLILDDED